MGPRREVANLQFASGSSGRRVDAGGHRRLRPNTTKRASQRAVFALVQRVDNHHPTRRRDILEPQL